MDNLLYVAMNGASNILAAQTLQMNNLANLKTPGFREDLQVFVSDPVPGGIFETRVYAQPEENVANLNSGVMVNTGSDLDVAIQGKGWFAVTGPQGTEALTRAGNFIVDANGQLVTPQGFPVLGDGGPITVPPASKLIIGDDGTVSIRPLDQSNGIAVIGRLKLANPEESNLIKGEDGFFYRKDGLQVSPSDPNVRVKQGMIEHSNVNAMAALIDIISLQRQFEMEVKLMKQASDAAAQTSQAMDIE